MFTCSDRVINFLIQNLLQRLVVADGRTKIKCGKRLQSLLVLLRKSSIESDCVTPIVLLIVLKQLFNLTSASDLLLQTK